MDKIVKTEFKMASGFKSKSEKMHLDPKGQAFPSYYSPLTKQPFPGIYNKTLQFNIVSRLSIHVTSEKTLATKKIGNLHMHVKFT